MNCTDMMQIAELEDVLKLKAGEKGLWHLVRWIYFADCLQCIKSEYKIENYIHGGEFVILTNRGVTDDSAKGDWENEDSLTLGQNIKRMISTEFSFYTKEDILVLPQAGSILVLIPVAHLDDEQIRDIFSRIIERVQREQGTRFCVGVGNSAAYLDEVKRSRNEASAAIRAASAANMQERIFFYKDQGIYTLISHVDDTRVLDEYVEAQLGKLVRYDEMNAGSLCETLENYLINNCNAKRTAEAMFVHRNTLNYRLKKIGELLNCDFEDMDKCLELKLAFLIRKYRNR